jgi:hypothetical protein
LRWSSPPWWWSIFPVERRAVALALVLALAGCAKPALDFERRGVTPARQGHDLAECKKEAFDPYGFAWRQSDRYDRDALTRCMARKGYSVRQGQ